MASVIDILIEATEIFTYNKIKNRNHERYAEVLRDAIEEYYPGDLGLKRAENLEEEFKMRYLVELSGRYSEKELKEMESMFLQNKKEVHHG